MNHSRVMRSEQISLWSVNLHQQILMNLSQVFQPKFSRLVKQLLNDSVWPLWHSIFRFVPFIGFVVELLLRFYIVHCAVYRACGWVLVFGVSRSEKWKSIVDSWLCAHPMFETHKLQVNCNWNRICGRLLIVYWVYRYQCVLC